jgi:hypothetical protein
MHDEFPDENEIGATVRALEAADAELRPREWPTLADRRLREQVGQRLQGLGRQLLTVGDGAAGTVEGYLSGWSDEAAEVLARDPNDLQENDLAVLTLIYLHSEILERILGEEVLPVAEQLDAHKGSTGRDVIRGDDLQESLARLKAHQLITPRYKPGPAFRRLTPTQRQRLEDNLILLLRPDSVWAREIRMARQARDSSEEGP